MKYLLDTHILIWWLNDNKKLKTPLKNILSDPNNEVYVSIASTWEISIKAKTKKLPLKTSLETVFENIKFEFLDITNDHILEIYNLPLHHKDPFDRMLIAQAKVENLTLITADLKMKKYDISIIGLEDR